MDFVRREFRAAGRAVDDGGVRALIDALGSDLREIASACAQLAADTTGVIDQSVVARYYRGRAEASGFSVADRAVEGRLSDALELLRWALAVGVAPVLISSGLAQGVRLLGRVSGAPKGQGSAELAAEVGAPPWKIDRVRQQLRGWEPDGIARALSAVAEADAQVKGEGTSPGYALEVAIRTIVSCRSGSAARLAMADLRFAAWFLWIMPLLAALSRLRQASRMAATAASVSPASAASRNLRTLVFRDDLTALLRCLAFSFCLLRLIWDLMLATRKPRLRY